MITNETGREYRRSRRHIHLDNHKANDLSEEPEAITMHSTVNNPLDVTTESIANSESGPPDVTRESNGESQPNPPDNEVLSGPRRSTRIRSVSSWHKDYVL